jgi:hypothetical protein
MFDPPDMPNIDHKRPYIESEWRDGVYFGDGGGGLSPRTL